MSQQLVRHTYTVSVDVPAQSGDGWNRYPDYSAEEVGRALRRVTHDRIEGTVSVTHVHTVIVPK